MHGATPRRRVALAFTPEELLDALDRAGVTFAPGAHLVTVVHRPELDQVMVVVDAAGYPVVHPGAEPPRVPVRAVQQGLRVVADRAAAAVDMRLVPRQPVPGPEPGKPLPPLEGDGGIGVGMAVQT